MAVDKSDLRPGYEASLVVYACNNCGTTMHICINVVHAPLSPWHVYTLKLCRKLHTKSHRLIRKLN